MKKFFYELTYIYVDENNDSHYFSIGYFSSIRTVRSAINCVKDKEGFAEGKGRFEIDKFAVNFSEAPHKKDGLALYELSHEYLDEDGYDNFIVFGVYATYKEAKKNQKEKITQRPYSKYPDGFCIAKIKVDLCGWQEGFSSW